MNRITYLLFQANPSSLYGKGVAQILSRGDYSELVGLLRDLKEVLTEWPGVLRTTWNPAQLNELKLQLLR